MKSLGVTVRTAATGANGQFTSDRLLRPLSVYQSPTWSAAAVASPLREKLRHDFGRDVVSARIASGCIVGAGGKQNERSAARLLSEGEARPLHFLRQLPANASEGILAIRRPEAIPRRVPGDRPTCTWASQRPQGVD